MNISIKKLIIIMVFLGILLVTLHLILHFNTKNSCESIIDISVVNEHRKKYVQNILKMMNNKEYTDIYSNLTGEAKKTFTNEQELGQFIQNRILVSDRLQNSYYVDIDNIYQQDNIRIGCIVNIAPSNLELAKEILKTNKVVRDIYIEIEEISPTNFKIYKMYEKEE